MQVSATRTGNWLKIGKGIAVISMVSWVSACAPLLDQDFWDEATSFTDENFTALGLQQLASGDYASAEKYFDEALRKNSHDGHAMLWRSVLYQNTNRPDRARDGYDTLIAMNPPGTVLMSTASGTQPRPLRDAAEFNLSRLQRGLPGSLSINDQLVTGPSGLGNGAMAAATGRPANMSPMAGEIPSSMASSPVKPMDIPAGAALSAGDEAIAKRFAILRNLQSVGLVTPEEYSARRSANLGALLPMSQPAPSAFLNNPPPESAQVEQRLNQLNRALQIGAITVQEHVAERTAILDALLPAQPRQRATPSPAPQGLMDAARQIARIEDLQQMKLVTPDEFKRERDAIEAAIVEPAQGTAMTLNSGEPVRRVATGESRPVQAGDEMAAANPAPMAASSGSRSVHLASYRNEGQAERGWQILTGRYSQLAPLQHGVTRANIAGKGTYYRLMATGLSTSAAQALCADLKRRGQFCEVK
jgi:tetratricopeptide (TPR) repeat protein